ncbi:MAG: phosphoglucosamine mutase, partial [Clostridia bacterium]|nr:phosphoglucosamine mutase [Clostridia bacterium]
LNINSDCGSMHIENLIKKVKEEHLDVVFAFDGDGDRCIAVDNQGNVVDGDAILYILGNRLKSRGMLNNNTIVATIMSNSGLISALEKVGIQCSQTTVGDRFVYERMQEGDYALGGEHSGHIILKKYATTGDGLLTAIMLAEEICDTKSPLSDLWAAMSIFPQITRNVRVADKSAVLRDDAVTATLHAVNQAIHGSGRALLRESGTEPVIRIMVECESKEKCEEYAARLEEAIRKGGYIVE